MAVGAHAAALYSNGAAVDGASHSVLVAPGSTLGWGAQVGSNNRVADDFTVPLGGSWNVESLSLFAYQTGSTAFSFTSAIWQIIAGDLNTGTVVAAGTTAVSNEGLTGFRVTNTTLASTARPIYQIGVDIPDIELMAGGYWLTWSVDGTLASGPWVPSLTGSVSGNAAQSLAGGAFNTVLDTGNQSRVDLPFALNGTVRTHVPEPTSLALVLAAGLAAGWARKGAAPRTSV